MSKKILLHAALTSFILASSAPTHAVEPASGNWQNMMFTLGVVPPLAFLGISAWALKHNHPTPDFKQNGEWKELLNFKHLLKDRKAYLQNLSDVFWTRWIGQEHKSGYPELDNANKTWKPTKKCLPYGVMGVGSGYVYEVTKAKEWYVGIAALYLGARALWNNPAGTFKNPFGPRKSEPSEEDKLKSANLHMTNQLLRAKTAKLAEHDKGQ